MARVVIDTEGVRSLAQYTRGAVDQVARIRTELLRVRQVLDIGPGAAHFGPLLASLVEYGTVLSDDHRSLVTEVLTIEQEEGDAPQGTDEGAGHTDASRVQVPAILGTLPIFGGGGPRPLPPPQPWNTTWVLPGGAVPVGTGTRVGPAANQDGDPNGFGPKWTERSEAGNAHGGQSWASYQEAAQRAAQAPDGGSGGWGEGQAPDPGPVVVDDGSGHQRGFDPALHSAVTGYGDLVGDIGQGYGQAAVDYTKGFVRVATPKSASAGSP